MKSCWICGIEYEDETISCSCGYVFPDPELGEAETAAFHDEELNRFAVRLQTQTYHTQAWLVPIILLMFLWVFLFAFTRFAWWTILVEVLFVAVFLLLCARLSYYNTLRDQAQERRLELARLLLEKPWELPPAEEEAAEGNGEEGELSADGEERPTSEELFGGYAKYGIDLG